MTTRLKPSFRHTIDARRLIGFLAAASIAIAVPMTAAADDPDDRSDPRIEKAMKLFREGRDAKGEKLLDKLRADRPNLEPEIQCALAGESNRRGDYANALAAARQCAEQASTPGAQGQSRAEMLVATAGSGERGEELATRLSSVREFLVDRPDDEMTDRVRRSLCRARELLPDSHESSLARSAMPEGRIKFLPKSDPAKGFDSVKPQRVFDREVDQNFEGVGELSGVVKASFSSTIDADGCFASARITESTHEVFEAPALVAVRGWVYRPPRLNGTAVAMHFGATVFLGVGEQIHKPLYLDQ